MPAGLPLLHQLLNSPLVFNVLKADGSTTFASANLDFGSLAQGLDQISATSLTLKAIDNQTQVASDATLTAKAMKLPPACVMLALIQALLICLPVVCAAGAFVAGDGDSQRGAACHPRKDPSQRGSFATSTWHSRHVSAHTKTLCSSAC